MWLAPRTCQNLKKSHPWAAYYSSWTSQVQLARVLPHRKEINRPNWTTNILTSRLNLRSSRMFNNSSLASDVFKVVSLDEIPTLQEVFERNFPKYFPLKQYVRVLKEYKEAKVEPPYQTIYRYGDVENGVYIIQSAFPLVKNVKYSMYYVYTACEDLSEMKYAFMNTKQIPWTSDSDMFQFEITHERFAPVIFEVAKTKGVDFTIKKWSMLWVPDPIDPSTIPEDVYLQRLNLSHAAEVNNNWPHRFPGSEVYLGQQIFNNYCLGLFRKTDHKLVSSALTFHSGGMYVMYVDPEFRNKGYAEVVLRNLTYDVQQKGRIPFGIVLLDNTPSLKLTAKLKFQYFSTVYSLDRLKTNIL
ncbi:uncharacterized protein LOC128988106 [Macrosteles quadrilineatus]|uniref:uncharacterized protein LOC128988106 n=1 Tax=Macrosteles quadrilineatus TaxID=74068 RepID=UPI0023E1121A|nr:uncharacterized protein LOC128988106 [Macrosteles quadrilineatus]